MRGERELHQDTGTGRSLPEAVDYLAEDPSRARQYFTELTTRHMPMVEVGPDTRSYLSKREIAKGGRSKTDVAKHMVAVYEPLLQELMQRSEPSARLVSEIHDEWSAAETGSVEHKMPLSTTSSRTIPERIDRGECTEEYAAAMQRLGDMLREVGDRETDFMLREVADFGERWFDTQGRFDSRDILHKVVLEDLIEYLATNSQEAVEA